MGAGKYARMMRRRQVGPILPCGNPPSGWRYLHDELSGGFFAGGHMQYKSTYNCENIIALTDPADYSATATTPTTGYPLTNAIIDLAQISTDFPTSTRMRLFNQLNYSQFLERSGNIGPGWNGTDFVAKGGQVGSLSSRSQFDPFTFALVIDGMNNSDNVYIIQASSGNPRLQNLNATTTRFWIGTSFTDYVGKNYATSLFKNSGLKLLVATWDGSGTAGGADVYINDMTTALSGTNASAGTFTNTAYNAIQVQNNQNVNTLTKEIHFWDYAMDATDRGTLKTILEQYYTFT
jgi:hypothetical protein